MAESAANGNGGGPRVVARVTIEVRSDDDVAVGWEGYDTVCVGACHRAARIIDMDKIVKRAQGAGPRIVTPPPGLKVV